MATVGQPLLNPESGWTRYEDTYSNISYIGNVKSYYNISGFSGKTSHEILSGNITTIRFNFTGTKIRLIAGGGINIQLVIIDGISYTVPVYQQSFIGSNPSALIFEKLNLIDGEHYILFNTLNLGGYAFEFDAVDLDSGKVLKPFNIFMNKIKSDLTYMQIGDVIPCRYTALISGQPGYFSELGICTATEIPVTGTATPDGLFYFIMVGYDSQGRKKLIADRNLQTNMSWNTLNTAGICSGVSINDVKSYDFTSRLLTGGISSSDTDNEWDKIIASSTLNGTIIAGDNSIWNWNGMYSWTSTTNTAGNIYRTVRGSSSVSNSSYVASSSTSGFRPVLLVESLKTIKYLLQQELNIYDLSSDIPDVLANLPILKTLTEGQTCIDVLTETDINNGGCDDLSKILQAKNLLSAGSKYKIMKFRA